MRYGWVSQSPSVGSPEPTPVWGVKHPHREGQFALFSDGLWVMAIGYGAGGGDVGSVALSSDSRDAAAFWEMGVARTAAAASKWLKWVGELDEKEQ